MHDDVRSSSAGPQDRSEWTDEAPVLAERSNARDHMVVDLTAAVIAFHDDQPVVLTRPEPGGTAGHALALPSGLYHPSLRRSLDAALRERVSAVTGLDLGYVEQLSTDCDPTLETRPPKCHLAIGYLALMRVDTAMAKGPAPWISCYDFFPWEDWRKGRPTVLGDPIMPGLLAWADRDPDDDTAPHPLSRRDRLRMMFGLDSGTWDDERVGERLAILEEAGLADTGIARPMRHDHRRILATALGRLRAKIRNRPLVFELLPPDFTLFELQKTVEAILGPHLHKQNFRRLVEGTGLVEPTGEVRTHTGGRPAKLFRFRREVLLERPAPGVRIRAGRAA